jgi:hypothetical protein
LSRSLVSASLIEEHISTIAHRLLSPVKVAAAINPGRTQPLLPREKVFAGRIRGLGLTTCGAEIHEADAVKMRRST